MDYSFVELVLPAQCVMDCSQSGPVDSQVAHWMARPEIRGQFRGLTLVDTARILYGYGAWEAHELGDIHANKSRILWLACGDALDNEDDADEYPAFMEGHGYTDELSALG